VNEDAGQLPELDVGQPVSSEREGAPIPDDDGARSSRDAGQIGRARPRRGRGRGRGRGGGRTARGDRRMMRVDDADRRRKFHQSSRRREAAPVRLLKVVRQRQLVESRRRLLQVKHFQ